MGNSLLGVIPILNPYRLQLGMIGRAVDLVVFMEKTPDNRRQISNILRVDGFDPKTDTYKTEYLYKVREEQ